MENTQTGRRSTMDIKALGYVVVGSTDLSRWNNYGRDVLGMMPVHAPNGGLYLKMDERDFRLLIVPAEENAYFASGWELADEPAFEAALAGLQRAGVEAQRGSAEDLVSRKVQALAWFHDPAGNRHEISWGAKSEFRAFVSPVGVPRFITEDMGLGHTVLPAPNFDETYTFLHDVMGFRLSDIFRVRFTPDPDEPEKRIYFLHCNNPREHSLAIMELPSEHKCVHMMLEVEDMDQVGRAMDRMLANEVKLSATLGRHCNDQMISFYMKTPGGFDIEYGYGGVQCDWSKHSVFEATQVSQWGHDFSVGFK